MNRHVALLSVLAMLAASCASRAETQTVASQVSPRVTYNFNPCWRFIRQDVPGSEAPQFDDSQWQIVSTPHTYNDVDSFDEYATNSGEAHLYMGPARYRKHFKLPAEAAGNKVFIEFEGLRQAAKFWVNGTLVGKHENGVTPFGLDITDVAHFGDKDNVLAVWITNVVDYKEESTATVFQWESRDFNPNYGGINQNVWLHITGRIYQTLPLLDGLGTTGTYIYATDIDLAGKTATVNVESQVRNESGQDQSVTLTAEVMDAAGAGHGQIEGPSVNVPSGGTVILKASGRTENIDWWSPDNPALYEVGTSLIVDGKGVDVVENITGFRKTAFKGGAGTGGVYINDRFTYLKGYAIRSINEWAAVGGAYPDWMSDFDARMIRGGHGNYIRWMHIAPKPKSVRTCDRAGIVQICPAGDKEADVHDQRWDQRVDVMRKTIVYYRNSPSILFWEAGNNGISAAHMQQMVDLRKELDPDGGRVMGCRTLNDPATTRIAEYFGVMVGQDRRTEQLTLDKPTEQFRAFSYERRDLAPFIETEDFRDEVARRFWDPCSPPDFAATRGPDDNPTYWHPTQEDYCLAAARRYNDFWINRICNTDPLHARWSGYASIIWADSNQHGRMHSSAVCRTSGKVDAVRIPKQAYFLYRVMESEQPDIHIIGHWSYPAGTKKTMYVAANNVDSVELFINGRSIGKTSEAADGFIYSFQDVAFSPGTIKAVGYKAGQAAAQHELTTAGDVKAIRLTVHTGPQGLLADGADVAFVDVEAVDAQGNRCPCDEARVDFELTGPGVWRGGVNEGIPGSTNNAYLNTECGINRVFIRSTLTPGTITLTARREGLPSAAVTIEAKPFAVKDGLSEHMPQTLGDEPPHVVN
jgi:beta-galactosidase